MEEIYRRKVKRRATKNQRASSKMTISTYLLIIILNINELNVPIKDIGWLNG